MAVGQVSFHNDKKASFLFARHILLDLMYSQVKRGLSIDQRISIHKNQLLHPQSTSRNEKIQL